MYVLITGKTYLTIPFLGLSILVRLSLLISATYLLRFVFKP